MLTYCEQNNLKIFINMLENPEILNLFSTVPDIKSWILSRIDHVSHPVIAIIKENLNQGSNNITGTQILNFLAPLDQRRELNVEETFSELVKCLKLAT